MRNEYDFSDSKPNPYASALKKQITIRLDVPTIEYFKRLSSEVGIPYQSLINHYLRECAESAKKPRLEWRS
jgi:predicted DNA binding CopG/RHH family protein